MTSLNELKRDREARGFQQLIAAGFTLEDWLNLCDAEPWQMRRFMSRRPMKSDLNAKELPWNWSNVTAVGYQIVDIFACLAAFGGQIVLADTQLLQPLRLYDKERKRNLTVEKTLEVLRTMKERGVQGVIAPLFPIHLPALYEVAPEGFFVSSPPWFMNPHDMRTWGCARTPFARWAFLKTGQPAHITQMTAEQQWGYVPQGERFPLVAEYVQVALALQAETGTKLCDGAVVRFETYFPAGQCIDVKWERNKLLIDTAKDSAIGRTICTVLTSFEQFEK